MQDPVYTITIKPSPLRAGATAEIKYDGPVGTVLTLDWDPSGEPTSVTIGSDGKTTFTVPANATSLLVTDPHGNNRTAIVGT